MSVDDFLRNNTSYGRDITDPGCEFPEAYLVDIYQRIRDEPIHAEGEGANGVMTLERWKDVFRVGDTSNADRSGNALSMEYETRMGTFLLQHLQLLQRDDRTSLVCFTPRCIFESAVGPHYHISRCSYFAHWFVLPRKCHTTTSSLNSTRIIYSNNSLHYCNNNYRIHNHHHQEQQHHHHSYRHRHSSNYIIYTVPTIPPTLTSPSPSVFPSPSPTQPPSPPP